ncbi:hypothetical protein FEE95_13310 [Maribacter algarum]|uniref:DUF4268 domain-containing protein n=1 Tax=Maribacter algarum (ex Zhang et al. 2020) TaxID=2578118 RepID=A0A5S3PWS9_9FLAO|nr:hypothetical protein [Maribacter algarum]TMM57458.1 hypothetical protein FEE95_13310 [Maribacter algarum]
MEYDFYIEKFQKSANQLNKNLIAEKQLVLTVGTLLNSVVFKLYKKRWTSDKADPLNAKTRIFFSIWVSESTIKQGKIFYNIHAFKLRELKGYSIASREFANKFRKEFKNHQDEWENVSVKFGPLTLMEGWHELDDDSIENTVVNLANNFIKIEYIIDKILKTFENQNQ